jgi:hypothetical protein
MEEMPEKASGKREKGKIWLDKSPIKKHGSTKAAGSLNVKDLTISEYVPISELDEYTRRRLE